MSILDMDVTPRRHAGYIRTREFATIRKGYDPEQVRQFLDQVAGWFAELEDDVANARTAEVNARAQAEAAAAAPAPAVAHTPDGTAVAGADDPYAALGARVAEVLRTAEEHAARIREEAEASVHQMLEQARLETTSLRQRAQEEADAIRVSAQQQAETTRQTAQDDADRVRDEAARALESARVEAERTVAGLTERRTVLTAELHAARTRLLGIVSQLEEDVAEEPSAPAIASVPPSASEDEAFESSESAESTPVGGLGRAWAPAGLGDVPPDDPRRDPIPHDFPAFVPPQPPRRQPLPSALAADPDFVIPPPPGDAEVFATSSADAPAEESEGTAVETGPDASSEAEPPAGSVESEAAVEEPEAADLASVDEPEAADLASVDEPAAIDPEPDDPNSMGAMWTPEEKEDQGPDLSLPDFPQIDIP